jgi:hypothetical protein
MPEQKPGKQKAAYRNPVAKALHFHDQFRARLIPDKRSTVTKRRVTKEIREAQASAKRVAAATVSPQEAREKQCWEVAKILGVTIEEASDPSEEGRRAIVAKLKAARDVELHRKQKKSWNYDPSRHELLFRFWCQEEAYLNEYLTQFNCKTKQSGPANQNGQTPALHSQTLPL